MTARDRWPPFAQRRFEQRLMRQPSLPPLKAAQVALSSA
jgi:hypothetical protein